MSAYRPRYIGARKPRQSPPFYRGVAAAAMALSLGACSAFGLPGASGELITGSVPANHGVAPTLVSASVVDKVDPSDWETVRRTIAGASATSGVGRIEWTNPDTGSSGTIVGLDVPTDRKGQLCRSFSTTISDARGIRGYRGDACRRTDGRWQLFDMIPDDAKLS
jgi:surface antigen